MKQLTLAFVSALALAFGACKEGATTATDNQTQRHPVRGIVRGIGFADREITVEHEEIPGYMPAMTMPFSVREMKEVEALKVGDAIAFDLLVTDSDSWIAAVRRVDANAVRLPATKPTPAAGTNARRLREGDVLPDFELVDDQGRPISRQTFAGKPLVLTFIFTRCPLPNFCPLISTNMAAVSESSGSDAALRDTRLLSISFDPEHDTPEALAQYAARYRRGNPDLWRFAVGTPQEVERLTSAFAVQVKPESGTINHSLATALIGPDGTIRNIWRGNGWKSAEVLEALRELGAGK